MTDDLTKPLTAEKRTAFLDALARCGSVTKAAKKAGTTRQNAYLWRQNDIEFATLWDNALEISTDALESEARRRAIKGVRKPVFHQGMQCGEILEYSDTLLIFLLKGNRASKFRDNHTVEHSGPGGTPLTIKVIGGEASMDQL